MILDWLTRLWRRPLQPLMICMRQDETWRWPPHLGAKTAGECIQCGTPIFYEAQNAKYRKICNRCSEQS